MKQISFTIPGEPRVQKRHRDRGKGRGKYDPSAKDKESFLVQAMAQCRPDEPIEGGLTMTVICYVKDKCGDVDNYLKFVMDALAGIYYVNDSQIHLAIVHRHKATHPATSVCLSPCEEGPELLE